MNVYLKARILYFNIAKKMSEDLQNEKGFPRPDMD